MCLLRLVCLLLLHVQNVIQSYFREWLHTTGNIRQVRPHSTRHVYRHSTGGCGLDGTGGTASSNAAGSAVCNSCCLLGCLVG